MTPSYENKASSSVRRRYNRLAPVYDIVIRILESRGRGWRQLLWSKVEGKNILEVGVGTGKNFSYYPKEPDITAIDFSEGMLSRARRKAKKSGLKVRLEQMDIERLSFPDNSFDAVVGSWVFCSIADPARGLSEVYRVLKPGGKLILLEHTRSPRRLLGKFMDIANPLANLLGDNINRMTEVSVIAASFKLEHVTNLQSSIFKLIEARKA